MSYPVFTTNRKETKSKINISRKGSIVKERCKQLTQIIGDLFPDRSISDDDLVCLIQEYIGADKETVRAYKGYGGHIRAGRCGDNRIVGVSRKGYLEVMGFLRKIPGHRWAVCQAALLPTQVRPSERVSEIVGSNEKISISTSSPKSVCVQSSLDLETSSSCSRELEKKEVTEKERNISPKISPKNLECSLIDDENLRFLNQLAIAGRKVASNPK